jgi:tubulin-specific chaperone A
MIGASMSIETKIPLLLLIMRNISPLLFYSRLIKEVNYYKKEVTENEAKLAAMKEQQKDPYDIKKFEEVLGESYMMVPDSEHRLKKSLEELSLFLKSDEFQGTGTGEWEITAKDILTSHLAGEEEALGAAGDVLETDVNDLKDDEAF